MGLKVGKYKFGIEGMWLGAVVFEESWRKHGSLERPDGVRYSLSIECQPTEIDGDQWEPELRFNEFIIDRRRWPDIAGVTLSNIDGQARIEHYHGEAKANRISFTRRSGRNFSVSIEGTCDVCAGSYGFDAPFKLTGIAQFDGYRVIGTFRDTEESLTALLAEHIDLFGLVPVESSLDGSTARKKMRSKNFVPVKRLPKSSG